MFAQIRTKMCVYPGIAQICATKQSYTKPLATINGTISRNMPTNFEPKQFKLKLDFKKIELGGFAVEPEIYRTVPKNSTLIFGDLDLGFGRETLDCG